MPNSTEAAAQSIKAASAEHSFDFKIENGNILVARRANRRQPLVVVPLVLRYDVLS